MKLNRPTKSPYGNWFASGKVASADFRSFATASAAVRANLKIDRLTKAQSTEVHAAVALHAVRAAAPKLPVPQTGRILTAQTAKRADFAVQLGEAYHNRIKSLYASQRASVVYGPGGQSGIDRNAYSKSYGHPAVWSNAGARIEGQRGAWVVVVETARGTEVARIPVDFALIGKILLNHPGLIDGDLWGVERHGVIERFVLKRGHLVKIGVAVPFTRLVARTYNATERTQAVEWEHGKTIAECRAENARKIALREAEWTRWAERDAITAAENARRAKIARAAKLIAGIVKNLPVRYSDARAVGHCDAGIRGWCAKHGIDPEGEINLARLRELAKSDSQAQRVLRHVAETCATQLIAA